MIRVTLFLRFRHDHEPAVFYCNGLDMLKETDRVRVIVNCLRRRSLSALLDRSVGFSMMYASFVLQMDGSLWERIEHAAVSD